MERIPKKQNQAAFYRFVVKYDKCAVGGRAPMTVHEYVLHFNERKGFSVKVPERSLSIWELLQERGVTSVDVRQRRGPPVGALVVVGAEQQRCCVSWASHKAGSSKIFWGGGDESVLLFSSFCFLRFCLGFWM